MDTTGYGNGTPTHPRVPVPEYPSGTGDGLRKIDGYPYPRVFTHVAPYTLPLQHRLQHYLVKYCQHLVQPAPHPMTFSSTIIISRCRTSHCQPQQPHRDLRHSTGSKNG